LATGATENMGSSSPHRLLINSAEALASSIAAAMAGRSWASIRIRDTQERESMRSCCSLAPGNGWAPPRSRRPSSASCSTATEEGAWVRGQKALRFLGKAITSRIDEVPRIMARMRSPRYATAYTLAGVTSCINISGLFVDQLVLEIEQPKLRQVATFGGGKAAIVVATIPEGALVHGKSVKEIAQDERFPEECVIAGIFRKEAERFIFPRGSIEILSGDQLFLAADTANIRKAAQFLQRTK